MSEQKSMAELNHQMGELVHQTNELKKAIREAAIKAGIILPDAEPDGPMLLMLCQDLAGMAKRPALNPLGAKGPSALVVTLTDENGDSHTWIPGESRLGGNTLRLIDNLSGQSRTARVQFSVRSSELGSDSDFGAPLLSVKLTADEMDAVQESGEELEEKLQRIGDHFVVHKTLAAVTEANLRTGELLSITLVDDQAAADSYIGDTTEPGRIRSCVEMHLPGSVDERSLLGTHIIVSGDPGGKLTFTGPFEDHEDALREAERCGDSWVLRDIENFLAEMTSDTGDADGQDHRAPHGRG